jgi:HlyD family secretion protein
MPIPMAVARPVLLASALAGLAGCGGEPEAGLFTGYVEAEQVRISAPRPGWLVELSVREGDEVKAGQRLFALDADQEEIVLEEARARLGEAGARARDAGKGARPAEIATLEAQQREAKVQLDFAVSERERGDRLAASGAIADARMNELRTQEDAARARLSAATDAVRVAKLGARSDLREAAGKVASAAESAVGQAQWALDQRRIDSRVAGRVERITYREGEYVGAGAPVVTLLPPGALKVRFFVPQADLPRVRVGGEAQVSADGLDAPVTARISYVAAESEFTPPVIFSAKSRDRLVFAVEARLPEGATLTPGVPVDVRVTPAASAP